MIWFGTSTKKHKTSAAVIAVALLLSVLFMSACSCGHVPSEAEASPSPDSGEEPPAVATPGGATAESTPTPGSTESPEPSVSVEPTKPVGPYVPLCDPADDEFFSDAAFMGNSLMNGFELYTGLTTPDYYTATSMTVIAAQSSANIQLDNGTMGTMVDALCQKPYGKIYIELGINEIGLAVEDFIGYYSDMLDAIIAGQPNCDVYICGITPVSSAKNSSGEVFNMERIYSYNSALYDLAAEKGVYYLDLVSALAGADGFLPADKTFDGVHFTPELYMVWLDYVRTHHV